MTAICKYLTTQPLTLPFVMHLLKQYMYYHMTWEPMFNTPQTHIQSLSCPTVEYLMEVNKIVVD